MPKRERWRNVKGTASRVKEPRERLLVAGASAAASAWSAFLPRPLARASRDILVLRLDRIGDVLMSLPAVHALRNAFPEARIRLAVGAWSKEIAEDAPVDEILVWNAPWVGRPDEGASPLSELFGRARDLRTAPPDLAIDLQGDARALWLLAMSGAHSRVGYANTGSAALLTSVVELDESLSFVEQNYRAVEVAIGRAVPRTPFRWLDEDRHRRGRERLTAVLSELAIPRKGPVIGIHPGAGRHIKEWAIERFAETARRLALENGATLVLTGSDSERDRTEKIRTAAPSVTIDLAGKLPLAGFAELMGGLDAFISGDTSAMHFACALGVPSVAIFGPSDPQRYFSGGPTGFGAGGEHIALAPQIWCSPCNLIRRPPEECDRAPAPDCLHAITVDSVLGATRRVLNLTAG